MANQIKGMLYLFTMEGRRYLSIFWAILLSTLSITLILVTILIHNTNSNIDMVFVLSVPIYIYCAIYGFNSVKEDLFFTINLGALRKNIWISKFIYFIALSAFSAILITIVQKAFLIVTKSLGVGSNETFRLLHPANLLDSTILQQLVIDFSISFFILSFAYLSGFVFYKYGLVGGSGLISFLVIAILFTLQSNWFSSLNIQFNLMLFFITFMIGLIIYALIWPLMRKITVP